MQKDDFIFFVILRSNFFKWSFEQLLTLTNISSVFGLFQKPAETHLPALIAKEGIILEMDDMDGMHVWCFKFRLVKHVEVFQLCQFKEGGNFENMLLLHLYNYIPLEILFLYICKQLILEQVLAK